MREAGGHFRPAETMDSKMMKLLCTAAALIFAASPLAATTPDAAPVLRISYADLNLSTAAGRATLERRVRVAVSRLCHVEDHVPLTQRMAASRCRQETLMRGRATIAAAIARAPGAGANASLAAH
jgi:UrcA family protein